MAETALTQGPYTLTSAQKGGTSSGRVPEAGDAGNGNSFTNGGVEVLVVDNTGASARTVTFKDKDGNALTAVDVAASKLQVIGPFDVSTFGSVVKFTPSHAELECVVVNLTGGGLTNILTAR